jgi:hypothetical protein
MKSYLLLVIVLLAPVASYGETITCPSAEAISGTYRTVVEKGYEPNLLQIARSSGKWTLNLSTYWAPRPNDNGERGTTGDFSGELSLPTPWSCVALFRTVGATDNADGNIDAPVCVLVLRFIGLRDVYIEPLGPCDFFHGRGAYPGGIYLKSKEP